MMKITCDTFWLPKAGNHPNEYEDAWAISYILVGSNEVKHCTDQTFTGVVSEFRCAIADGATETSFSGEWADVLVKSFVTHGNVRSNFLADENLRLLQEEWHLRIDEKTRDKPLPWYAQEKLQQGAYSTLTGLQIFHNSGWEMTSVGDSACLLKRQSSKRWGKYPHNIEFTNHPFLISTDRARNVGLGQHQYHIPKAETWQIGDTFYLMTDALADYLFNLRGKQHLLNKLMQGQQQFEDEIHKLRQEKKCKNDDVTLVKIAVTTED